MRRSSAARRRLVAVLAVLAATLAAGATAQAARGPATGDLVLRLAPGASAADAEQLAAAAGGKVVAAIPKLGAYLVDLPGGSRSAARTAARSLAARSGARAAPTRVLRVLGSPLAADDPLLGSQWHLATIRAPEAWAVAQGDASIVIAVVDTGIAYDHPDLAGKVTLGADVATGDGDPMDTQGHGTHVAGIAVAATGNGIGVAGVCPGCQLLAVKVFPDGSGSTSDFLVAQGITWAADNGADVINLSLGGSTGSGVLQDAVNYAWSRGVIVVAAAGNSGSTAITYPAAYDNVVAVAATTSSDARASFSNTGSWVDVAAPGAGILSTVLGGGYQSWSGTSMAAPVVAAAAALALTKGGGAAAARAALESGVVDLGTPGWDASFGAGRIDLVRVLDAQAPPQTPPAQTPPQVPPPRVTTASLPAAVVGAPYAVTLTAAGGTPPYSWSLASGALPAGLALEAASGRIAGIPTAAGAFPLTVRVTDAAGLAAETALTITVGGPAPDLTGSWTRLTLRARRRAPTLTARLELRTSGASVSTPFTVRLSILDRRGAVVATRTVSVGGVSLGRARIVTARWTGSLAGATLRAEIDSGGAVAESNEANNTAETRIP